MQKHIEPHAIIMSDSCSTGCMGIVPFIHKHKLYSFHSYPGCMGMVALGREDIESQNKIAEQGGIQPLVRLLRSHKTSERVLLTVIKVIGTLCLGD